MSYPGRPPLVQGIPQMAYMSMSGPPPPLMSAVMPIQHMMPMQVTSATQIRAFPKLNPNREQLRQLQLQGPAVTVFVGNITERAPDTMIRQILSACGPVLSWKRVKGFGFCELAGPDAGLRAVRILHDLMVGEKRLVAKVDAKTNAELEEYTAEKRKKEKGSASPLQDEIDEDEPLDEESQAIDAQALLRIKQLLIEYEDEMNNFEMKKEEEVQEKRNKILDEADVEEEKRDLITREIGKFREIMKKQEEEREVSRKKNEKDKHGDRGRSCSHSPSPKRRIDKEEKKKRHTRSRSKEKNVEREQMRDVREAQREAREREREMRERERLERDRERERDRDRERERGRDRDRDREEKVTKSTKELQKEKEMEEEATEKKRAERRTREKEASYQERLRGWENRERKKLKEYEKNRDKDRQRDDDKERDAKRLKEFLEDYDDERDDVKFYKGRELQKRLAERVKEAEADERDRLNEREEIEELKNKIFTEGEFDDPTAEFERVKKEREDQYIPKLVIDVVKSEYGKRDKDRQKQRDHDRLKHREERDKLVVQQAAQELAAVEAEPIDSDSDMDNDHYSPDAPPPQDVKMTDLTPQVPDDDSGNTPNHDDESTNALPHPMKLTLAKPIVFSPHGQTRDAKRKKLDLREVFNPDEDDTTTQVKKRKLVPLDYNEDKKTNKKDKENGEKKSEEVIKSQEEKRKHIKSLIEKIPTEKAALFAYQLDWSVIDNALMEKKIRPWINKKIIEYIGEPEPTLVDFICSKVLAGSQPQIILEDVQMVLDEEAEVFVVKMWRLLIYEVEAKKLGIS